MTAVALSDRHLVRKRVLTVDAAALNNDLVLENNVVFGTVNANRLHCEQAADVLARADQTWLDRVMTRRVPLDRWEEAFSPANGDINDPAIRRALTTDGRCARSSCSLILYAAYPTS